MIYEYINAALNHAHYEIIDDSEPFYGEIKELPGVWATGNTLEECRKNLSETVEGWILTRNALNMDIPPLDGIHIEIIRELKIA
jgi:predicted RNase H-like HicB family nuclease